ncbi:hypothetical protein BSL78_01718 [Apostichopus japonicus]|uniref:Uncharacterized protein n=1 Tax=Stichopus japonicus TaxID=307972 RepID=A0A2G8LMF7_STIJA|nr:hypothetical protein BSL78_01718 [Apostichopus japonicus]
MQWWTKRTSPRTHIVPTPSPCTSVLSSVTRPSHATPQPYASTQLCPPQNTHFATAPKCTCGSSSNDTGCSSGTSGSQPCPNGTASKPSRAKSKPHRKKRSQRLQQPQQHQQRPANTWSDLLPPPPEEPPTDSRVPPHMQTPPYNYHTGSSNGRISEQGGSMPAVSELSDLDTVRGEVDTDFDGSSYCTGSLMASGLSIGGSCAEDEASEGSEEGERFLNGYPTHPTNSLPMVTIGNGIQVGSQV